MAPSSVKARVLAPLVMLGALVSACETTDGGKRIPAKFDCDDGGKLALVFDHEKDAAVVRLPKNRTVVLASQHPAAGMWYASDGYALRGSGDTLNYSAPDRPKTRCVQTR